MLVVENTDLTGPRWIINFPTKKHWRHPSKLEWVTEGLKDLVRVLRECKIKSVAIPPLGCGQGGLAWPLVKAHIEAALAELPEVDAHVFAPTGQYQNSAKRTGHEKLTPARALIAELVRRYLILGIECTNLEVQKLSWCLQRSLQKLGLPDPLDLRFQAHKYGPYAERLRHLLDGLDGSYLHCEKRLADAGPMEAIWFDDSKKEAVGNYLAQADAVAYLPALEMTTRIIDGFESPHGMELLATVDWLISEGHGEPNVAGIRLGLQNWAGGTAAAQRKSRLFDDRVVGLAIEKLQSR